LSFWGAFPKNRLVDQLFGEVRERFKAPAFSAPTSLGKVVQLSDYAGKYLVLYFYPKSFTPGCTQETILFRDHYAELQALGAEVLGISRDKEQTQCDFAGRYEVRFPIVSDSDAKICRAYAVDRRLWPVAKRVTFLIDKEGYVIGRFDHEFRIAMHVDDVLSALRTLRDLDKKPAG
jgi:thioredoxin-dependent peroxiredoxin